MRSYATETETFSVSPEPAEADSPVVEALEASPLVKADEMRKLDSIDDLVYNVSWRIKRYDLETIR